MKRGAFFFATAAILALGSAFTTAPKSGATPVYNTTAGLGAPVWVTIDASHGQGTCSNTTLRQCKGTKEGSAVTVTQTGNYSGD